MKNILQQAYREKHALKSIVRLGRVPVCSTTQQSKQPFMPKSIRQFNNDNRRKDSNSYASQALLLGGTSLMILSYLYSKEKALAEPKVDSDQGKRFLESLKEDHLKPGEWREAIFTLYDPSNPLHNEYLKEMDSKQVYIRILKKYPNVEIVHIDTSDPLLKNLLQTANLTQDKVSQKKRPTFLVRADDRLVKIKPTLMNAEFNSSFDSAFKKECSSIVVDSVSDLADWIGKFNTELNDLTAVYCQDPETMNTLPVKVAHRMMKHESKHPILEVRDPELIEKLKMQKGKFYCYYKPSFINGFEQYLEKDINFDYLQAFEGVCRDEFTLNSDYMQSQGFKDSLAESKGFYTSDFCEDQFDRCFTRTFNVEFVFNPNMEEFRKKFLYGKNATKPLMFIYSPPLYMSRYVGEFKQVLRNYGEVFDVYYTGDEEEAKRYFYLKEFPEIIPYVAIIDTKKRKELKSEAGLKELTLAHNNFYFQKFRELIFFNSIQKNLTKLIEKFLDGELQHYYQSERLQQDTRVKTICSANFEEQIIKNDQVQQCIIEVFKHDCPSCAFNGKVFNVFSKKLEKHGYAQQLPCYRLSIDNKVPYLGNFGYSPIYIYVKKQGNEIVELITLDPPQKVDGFLKQIGDLSKLKDFGDKIKLKPRDQILKHIKLEDLNEDFDIDFDTKEEPAQEGKEQK